MKKTIFKGELNGVEFTDEVEFNKVLKNTKEEDIKSVSVKKETVETDNENDEKPVENPVENQKSDDVIDTYSSLFKQLFNSWKDIFSDTETKETKKSIEEKQAVTTAKELLDKYLFKPTTYEFTGGDQDEIELDKFDNLLHKKRDEFSEIDFSKLPIEEADEFIKVITKDYVRVGNAAKELETKLQDYEYKIDKFNALISTCKDLGVKYEDYELQRTGLQHRFDIDINKKFYNELLHIYYRDLTNMIYE